MLNLKEYLNDARENKWAIGQFNFSTIEQFRGIIKAAKKMNTPIICGTSKGEVDFLGMEEVLCLVKIARERENIPVFLNLDHGRDFNEIKRAIDLGYDMVHFDGSNLPFEENIEITKKVVEYARKRGVIVEGEVSEIAGSSTVSKEEIKEVALTSAQKVAKFSRETDVDCTALGIGSFHGIHGKEPKLRTEIISEFLSFSNSFVVLHGGSGVREEDIRDSIYKGVVKINVNTELRLAWRRGLDKVLNKNKEEIVPYKILPLVSVAVYKKTLEKISLFNKN